MKFLAVVIIAAVAILVAIYAYIKERREHEADLRRDARIFDAEHEDRCRLAKSMHLKDKMVEQYRKKNEELLAELEYAKVSPTDAVAAELAAPMTNYRKIRSMSVDEMVDMIDNFEEMSAKSCNATYCVCCGKDGTCLPAPKGMTRRDVCRAATEKWLLNVCEDKK